MARGRFAPSPTGRLHIGNLRTALLAWLFARSTESNYLLRFEDLDQALISDEHYVTQAQDIADLGLDWDGKPVRQSDRMPIYLDAIADLNRRGLTYPCYCSRRDIREATQAPNGPQVLNHYPGTCRELTASQRQAKENSGRPAALRIRSENVSVSFVDDLAGAHSEVVDDFVVQRNDSTPAYNLVVVIDDDLQGIEQVVRGDDLLASTTRQLFIGDAFGLAPPSFAHVPLVMAPNGKRLAKRDGATTLQDRYDLGETALDVMGFLGSSLGLSEPGHPATAHELLERFDPALLPTDPLTLTDEYLGTEMA